MPMVQMVSTLFIRIPDLTVFVFQLYEDMSTWCSELKKMATSTAPSLYQLEPAPGVECPDRVTFVQDTATALLQQSLFLRDGVDENVSYSSSVDLV